EPGLIEPYAVVRDGHRHVAVGSRQANGDARGRRILGGVSERFLEHAEQRQRSALRQLAGAVVAVTRHRNAAAGAELLAVPLDGLREARLVEQGRMETV